jgi:hypothetical protein
MEKYIIELTSNEMNAIVGGTFWKDLGYGIGWVSNQIYGIATGPGSCNQVWQRW